MAITLASLAIDSNTAATQLRAPQQYGTKKRRMLTFTFVGDGASKTVGLTDISASGDNSQKISGLGVVERIEIVEDFHSATSSLPPFDSFVDTSSGMPGTLTFGAAPSNAVIYVGRLMVYGF